MLDKSKRKQFHTVGELLCILESKPLDTSICVGGSPYCYYHERTDCGLILIDNDDMEEEYESETER